MTMEKCFLIHFNDFVQELRTFSAMKFIEQDNSRGSLLVYLNCKILHALAKAVECIGKYNRQIFRTRALNILTGTYLINFGWESKTECMIRGKKRKNETRYRDYRFTHLGAR